MFDSTYTADNNLYYFCNHIDILNNNKNITQLFKPVIPIIINNELKTTGLCDSGCLIGNIMDTKLFENVLKHFGNKNIFIENCNFSCRLANGSTNIKINKKVKLNIKCHLNNKVYNGLSTKYYYRT